MIKFEHNCDEVKRQISSFIDEELPGDLHQFIVHQIRRLNLEAGKDNGQGFGCMDVSDAFRSRR